MNLSQRKGREGESIPDKETIRARVAGQVRVEDRPGACVLSARDKRTVLLSFEVPRGPGQALGGHWH